jgi:hypothetical protein
MDLSSLVQIIAPLVDEVDEKYGWPIPANLPVSLTRSSLATIDNLRLRAALHQKWLAEPTSRVEIARWYVRIWGGVKRTSDGKISEYVNKINSGCIPERLAGVASWSKIASISDPNRFLIYDARVAAALNLLQLKHLRRIHHPFPRLPSRNRTIGAAANVLAAEGVPAVGVKSKIDHYLLYLGLLEQFGERRQRAEMTLFAIAPVLAEEMLAGR